MNEIWNFLSISKVSWEHSPFFNVLSMAVFILKRQSWILVIGTIWPTESLKYTLSVYSCLPAPDMKYTQYGYTLKWQDLYVKRLDQMV